MLLTIFLVGRERWSNPGDHPQAMPYMEKFVPPPRIIVGSDELRSRRKELLERALPEMRKESGATYERAREELVRDCPGSLDIEAGLLQCRDEANRRTLAITLGFPPEAMETVTWREIYDRLKERDP